MEKLSYKTSIFEGLTEKITRVSFLSPYFIKFYQIEPHNLEEAGFYFFAESSNAKSTNPKEQ